MNNVNYFEQFNQPTNTTKIVIDNKTRSKEKLKLFKNK